MSELIKRPRRLRATPVIRGLVREHRVTADRLALPIFVMEGEGAGREAIGAMPGVDRHTIDSVLAVVESALGVGVGAFALFPRVEAAHKSADGASALRDDTLACRALSAVRRRFPGVALIADVALDPYSTDGHDGIVRGGRVVNDETVGVLARMAVAQAAAGADVVAPSDMMDGRVGAIRRALEGAGLSETVILSYTAKYASAFYGPFRDALGSAPVAREGVPADKSTYQMDPANGAEALIEARLDLDEGADMVMVKPGLPYLDVIHRLATALEAPVAAYHVSGEYAMLRAAAERGMIDYHAGLAESLTSLARAGARFILTYGAVDHARRLIAENGRG